MRGLLRSKPNMLAGVIIAISLLILSIIFPTAGTADDKPCVYALGDSLTASYGPLLADILPSFNIINAGLGGQSSSSIAARAGAIMVSVSMDATTQFGGVIHVSSVQPDILAYSGDETFLFGRLAGAIGRLVWNKKTGYHFEPSEPRTFIPRGNFPFVVQRTIFERCILVLWAGRNDFRAPAHVLQNIESIVSLWKHSDRQYYVLGIINGTDEGPTTVEYSKITELNKVLSQKYGNNYVDVQSLLVGAQTERGPYVIPKDLRADHVHLNSKGNGILANHLKQIIQLSR